MLDASKTGRLSLDDLLAAFRLLGIEVSRTMRAQLHLTGKIKPHPCVLLMRCQQQALDQPAVLESLTP